MATATCTPVFAPSDNAHPADMLEAAGCVACFLREMAPCMTEDNRQLGLSERGASGLYYILQGLEQTINAAAGKL